MSRPESKRRKDTCIECLIFKPNKAKDMCQNCWHKFKRKNQPNFFLRTRYTELKQRCIQDNKPCSKYYYGLEYCTLEEFLNKFDTDKQFLSLFSKWKENNYKYSLCPSIDRIEKTKGYIIGNMQFIEHGVNSRKDNENIVPVDVFDRSGTFIKTFECLNDAVRFFNVQQSNAWKVLYGQRKHTEGLVFKHKN